MLEVRIYDGDKCIWKRCKENMSGMTKRSYAIDGTYSRIKEVLDDALVQVDGNLGILGSELQNENNHDTEDLHGSLVGTKNE